MEREDFSYKGLFLFSLPSILSSLLEPLSATIDTALVGQVSTEWLGGMALAVTLLSSFTWMFNFLVHASTQSVASSIGSEAEGVSESVKTALLVALFIGIATTVFLWVAKPLLYSMVGVTPEIYAHTDAYFSIRVYGHCFTLLYTTLISLLRGLGRVNLGFMMVGLTTIINASITYLALFVFDWGLEGAAWGTTGSFTLGSIISFLILLRDKNIKGRFFKSKIKKEKWFRFGNNSINIFGRSFTLTTCFFLSTRFASTLGVQDLAAHQILLQVWLFCSFLLDGVAVTGTVLGAKYFSKGEKEKLGLIYKRLIVLGALIGFVFSIAYALGGELIVSMFTNDQEVTSLIFSFWLMIVLSQFFNAIAFVYDGLLFGLEDFRYLRKHMMIGGALVFLPIAIFGQINGSLALIWAGMIILNIYRGLSGFARVKRVVYE